MEIKNKLTVPSGEVGNEIKKGKGCPGTCIKNPWTKTMGRGRIECGGWG